MNDEDLDRENSFLENNDHHAESSHDEDMTHQTFDHLAESSDENMEYETLDHHAEESSDEDVADETFHSEREYFQRGISDSVISVNEVCILSEMMWVTKF